MRVDVFVDVAVRVTVSERVAREEGEGDGEARSVPEDKGETDGVAVSDGEDDSLAECRAEAVAHMESGPVVADPERLSRADAVCLTEEDGLLVAVAVFVVDLEARFVSVASHRMLGE